MYTFKIILIIIFIQKLILNNNDICEICFNFAEMDSMNVSRGMDNSISLKESLDLSGKFLDSFFIADNSFPTLLDKMQLSQNGLC